MYLCSDSASIQIRYRDDDENEINDRGATVRNIAEEAGLSLGALRHYFLNQDELLVYAMELVQERAKKRIEQVLQQNLSPKEMVLAVLLEIVPTNEKTLAEMKVWFALMVHLQHLTSEIALKDGDQILEGIQQMLHYLQNNQILKENLDFELEVERLYGLVDGLALHALLKPSRLNPEIIKQTLLSHLDTICT